MFPKAKTILTAATILGFLGAAAIPVLASEHNGQDKHYGGPVQTWCDINPDCNGWSKGLHRASPDRTHSPSHKHGHEASNR